MIYLLSGLGFALVAAVIVSWFDRPRHWMGRQLGRLTHAIRWRLYLERRARIQLAIDRISDYLAGEIHRADGNPDEQLRADWLAWFRGEAFKDGYQINLEHQKRVRERLDSGYYSARAVRERQQENNQPPA